MGKFYGVYDGGIVGSGRNSMKDIMDDWPTALYYIEVSAIGVLKHEQRRRIGYWEVKFNGVEALRYFDGVSVRYSKTGDLSLRPPGKYEFVRFIGE